MASIREDLRARVFRANPSFSLIPLAEISERLPAALPLLDGLRSDQDCFGVALPVADPRLGAKAVCRQTAALLASLRVAQTLPVEVTRMPGLRFDRDLAGLVSDGLLEVEIEGEFQSGPAAQAALALAALPHSADSASARLSYAALRYAQALPELDMAWLAGRLYHYNQVPESPRWCRQLATPADVQSLLGLRSGQLSTRILERAFIPRNARHGPDATGWHVWSLRSGPRSSPAEGELLGPKGTFKLYLSPRPEALAEAFAKAVPVLAEFQVLQFKVGRDRSNVLRPDKFVAYFARHADLESAAAALTAELAGLPAQGVPFTAAVDAEGLLSWGVDPPLSDRIAGWNARESWRLWIVHRLARALIVARHESVDIEPWLHALNRVALDGIDIDTWAPAIDLWQADSAASS
ncbi:MAG TPA: hypothetical protein VJV79_36400 [Polyangiaceae bacterium]|nr:hypothetical protein [Polyangiaceae bacterium]